jgi:hypothetical protein
MIAFDHCADAFTPPPPPASLSSLGKVVVRPGIAIVRVRAFGPAEEQLNL